MSAHGFVELSSDLATTAKHIQSVILTFAHDRLHDPSDREHGKR
jgi:hypothetical protein